MRYAISFLLGFCLSGLWFGCHTLLHPKLEPFAHGALEPFSPLLSAALPTVLVCIAAKTHPFHFSALELPFYAQSPSHREFAVKNFLFIVFIILLRVKNKFFLCNSLQIKEE